VYELMAEGAGVMFGKTSFVREMENLGGGRSDDVDLDFDVTRHNVWS
jgi:hypothetical protein